MKIIFAVALVMAFAETAMAAGPAIKPGWAAPLARVAARPVPKVVAHSKAVEVRLSPKQVKSTPVARPLPPTLTVTATCDLITVDAGAPAWVLIRTVEKGVIAPTPEQEQIVDEKGPVLGLSQGRGSYEWEISVTYSDTVEDRHGIVDC